MAPNIVMRFFKPLIRHIRNARQIRQIKLLLIVIACAFAVNAIAGTLTKAELEQLFPAPLVVGEKNTKLPVWPIFKKSAAALEMYAWAFESIDLEPIRGYSGKPINILVVMDLKGSFVDVRLREHKEPIFVSPEGTALVASFAQQYKHLSLQHSITMVRPKAPTHNVDGIATVNGLTAGTVTAVAMERSILESALKVAQSSLGDGASGRASRSKHERFEGMAFAELAQAGFVQNVVATHSQVEQGFVGTLALGVDDRPGQKADEKVVDMSVALVSLSQVGRNVLDSAGWAAIDATKNSGELTFMVTERGRFRLVGNEKKPAGVVSRLKLRSNDANKADELIDMRELPFEQSVNLPDAFKGKTGSEKPRFFTTIGGAGVDLTKPLVLAVQVTREVGFDPVRRFQSAVDLPYSAPNMAYWLTGPPEIRWLKQWKARAGEIALLIAGLVVLTVALWKQTWLSAQPKRLARFRFAYLVFTLGFIGWYAQGQLTIVNITALIEALRSGESAEFLLNDPFSIILWAYVFVSLFIWGRGTFCGWLCPFGALQEIIAQAGDLLRIKKIRLRMPIDAKLKWIKYAVLAVILFDAIFSGSWTEKTVEIEFY